VQGKDFQISRRWRFSYLMVNILFPWSLCFINDHTFSMGCIRRLWEPLQDGDPIFVFSLTAETIAIFWVVVLLKNPVVIVIMEIERHIIGIRIADILRLLCWFLQILRNHDALMVKTVYSKVALHKNTWIQNDFFTLSFTLLILIVWSLYKE